LTLKRSPRFALEVGISGFPSRAVLGPMRALARSFVIRKKTRGCRRDRAGDSPALTVLYGIMMYLMVTTQPTNITRTDVAVIGAGPIGLEMAVALKTAGIDYLHFDAKQIGYTISWFAPQTRFFSSNERIAIADVPLQTPDQSKATREQYLAYLRGVVVQHDLRVRTYEPVIGIERESSYFTLTTQPPGGTATIHANRIILCTGGTDHPRRLNIPGEDLPHVSHYFQDPHTYFRKRLLIVGGKNSAVEAALRCHHAGARVSLSYRREKLNASSIKYWLMPEITGLIESGRMRGYFNTVPVEITPSHVRLGAAPLTPESEVLRRPGSDAEESGGALRTRRDATEIASHGKPISEPFDFVLLLTGYEADLSLLKKAGVPLHGDCQAPAYNERTMETNIPGVYVAGCAIGGTQDKYSVFLENCHVHVPRIIAALTGSAPPTIEVPAYPRPES
jgi:thioredoxin reductase (NADPH)